MLDGMSISEPVEGDVICFTNDRLEPDTSKLETVTKKNLPDIKFLLKRKRAYVTLPLIGTNNMPDFLSGDEEGKIIREEGITAEDFNLPAMPELASSGLRREILLRATPDIKPGTGMAELKFYLPKGCYATTVLRELMKSSPEHMD